MDQFLRKSFAEARRARKAAPQGVGAGLCASVRCRIAVKLWCSSGIHPIAKLSLRVVKIEEHVLSVSKNPFD